MPYCVTNDQLEQVLYRESNNELQEINIKNRTCHYFDDIIKIEDFDHGNILTDQKSCENIFVHNISYKILIAAKSLHVVNSIK